MADKFWSPSFSLRSFLTRYYLRQPISRRWLKKGFLLYHFSNWVTWWVSALVGRRFLIYTSVAVASAHNVCGTDRWSSIHQTIFIVFRFKRSAIPFCWRVYGDLSSVFILRSFRNGWNSLLMYFPHSSEWRTLSVSLFAAPPVLYSV